MDLFCSVRRIIDNKIVIADIFWMRIRPGEIVTIQIGSMVINLQTEKYNVNYADLCFTSKENVKEEIEKLVETFIPQIKRTLNVG